MDRLTVSDRDRANNLMGDLADVMHYAEWRKTRDAIAQALADERRGVVGQLRAFAADLYDTTGARWIADALTSTLDRISEGGQP